MKTQENIVPTLTLECQRRIWLRTDTSDYAHCARLGQSSLKVDTLVETKLGFKLVKTTGHCSTVHGKLLIVLDFLVTTTSTDTLASKGTLNL